MTLQRVERYVIEPSAHGTVLRMRQGGRALGVALLSLVVLLVSWWFGPYGPRPGADRALSDSFYWLWSGFFGLVFILRLELQRTRSVDQVLEALRPVLALEVDDPRKSRRATGCS